MTREFPKTDSDKRPIILGALYIATKDRGYRLVRPWSWFAYYGGDEHDALNCEIVWPIIPRETKRYYQVYPFELKRADIVELCMRIRELQSVTRILVDELSSGALPEKPVHENSAKKNET